LEEVLCAFDPDHVLWIRCALKHRLDGVARTELVYCATDEELRLGAALEEVEAVASAFGAIGNSEADHAFDTGISAARLQANIGAEGESREQNGEAKVGVQPIHGCARVVDLFVTVEGTFAETYPTEVEAKDREAERREGLHSVIDDLVVKGASAEWMGVENQCSIACVGTSCIENSLEFSGGTAKIIDGTNVRRRCSHYVKFTGSYRMLEDMPVDPIQLTRKLVDIDSTTYHEGLAGTFLREYLAANRYAVECTPVSQPELALTPGAGEGERFNVYAALPGITPDVVLSTHMDTVPPFFGSSEDDEFIYGRGTCDAKGIIAAQIAAADRLREAGVKVGLLFVVGEERDSAGAKVANLHPKGSKFLINGEPTDNRLALATKGALRVELRAKGRMAHSAYPELGESAIEKLLDALEDLRKMSLPVEPEIGAATMNIGLVHGGRAPNVIPDKAEAHILIRTVGPSEELRDAILGTVGDRAEVTFSLDIGYVRMRKVGSLPTMVAKFATDIPALTSWGEPFLLGPGSIHVAHTPHEKIAKKELLECVDLYYDLATSLVS
jgi:acetylornithine deacetylase